MPTISNINYEVQGREENDMTWRGREGTYTVATNNACKIVYRLFTCVILTLNRYFNHIHPASSITLPMWDSKVTNYMKELSLANTASKMMWSYNATATEIEGNECKSAHGHKVFKGPLM